MNYIIIDLRKKFQLFFNYIKESSFADGSNIICASLFINSRADGAYY